MAKKWIGRDYDGLVAFESEPQRYYLNPFDEEDFVWTSNTPGIELDPSLFPEVTIENSPKLLEVEL